MLKDRIKKYIKELETQMELTESNNDINEDEDLKRHHASCRLIISDLEFMIKEEKK